MEVAITKYLRLDRLRGEKAPIHIRLCWSGHKVRFSSKDEIEPEHWDADEERVKKTATKIGKAINRRLDVFTTSIENYFENRATEPTEKDVQDEIKRIRVEQLGEQTKVKVVPSLILQPPVQETISLIDFFKQYTDEKKADRSREWATSLMAVKKHLFAFRPGLNWPDLKLNTLNLFKVYLQEESKLSDNSIHAYIGLMRGLCEYADRSGIEVPRGVTWVETRPGQVIRPVLQEQDLSQIQDATVKANLTLSIPLDTLERIRWFFLLSCYTGLRRVDQWQLLNPNLTTIENIPCLLALQQKTGRRVPIPLTDDAHYLLKNPVCKQNPPGETRYNTVLKELGEQSELTRLATVGSFYKGELLSDTLPLFQTMSSHMGRRTFATRMTEGGLNLSVLQEIMGHETISSTQRYTTVSNNMIVQQAVNAWTKAKTL